MPNIRSQMVAKDYSFDRFHTNPNGQEQRGNPIQPPISSPSHASYNTVQMEGPPRSPFEQGPPPSGGQPYAPHPQQQQPSPSQEGTPSNQYPQYSYDIQLRYPHDQNRPYSQEEHRQYPPPPPPPTNPQFPHDIPRQYAPIQGQGLPLPSLSTMSMPNQGYGAPQEMPIDTTGQVAPAGMKPRVTATLWEDEGTLCFQVDVKGTCVARREDNHMINGTKLLNVAGMTRGRRDGILKAEKQKHVVKIGPMHLKGVWIPYERALEFANKEKITESLYPLFVHNIGALLYHPINHARGYPAAHIPRRQDEGAPAPAQATGPVLFNSSEDARREAPAYS